MVAPITANAHHLRRHDNPNARRRARLIERHLPAEVREKPTWRHVASLLLKAAAGANMIDVGVALRMVLGFEGVECQPEL